MYQLSHMTAAEAVGLQGLLVKLGTERHRQFWSTTQTNTNDWHCRITDPTPGEIMALAALVRSGYGNVEGGHEIPTEAGT